MTDKYAAIQAERARFSVRLMCAALGVSSNGYYAAQRRAPSERAQADERLRVAVRTVFTATKGRYGGRGSTMSSPTRANARVRSGSRG